MNIGSETSARGRTGRTIRGRAARLVLGVLVLLVLFFAALASSAQAFTVKGGTEAQRAYVTKVIKACALPYATTDSELRAFGPVDVQLVKLDNATAYSQLGHVYIDADIEPGPVLGELAAHEWAHQIWYSLGPKWWQKWNEVAGAAPGAAGGDWKKDPAENFAESAKVALWDSSVFLRDYAVTDLNVVQPTAFGEWLATARFVKQCPFSDLSPNAMPSTTDQDELAAAGGYVLAKGLMQGYSDAVFGAGSSLTRGQLAQICARAGLTSPASWRYDTSVATRGEVRETIPGLTWTGERWSEPITRGQLARLLWRSR